MAESTDKENKSGTALENQKKKTIVPCIIVQAGGYRTTIKNPSTEEAYKNVTKKAARKGYDILKNDGTAVDAVETAVCVFEDSSLINAGPGSALNCYGQVECEALIMNGADMKTGAVTNVSRFLHPVSLARKVMDLSHHCAIGGDDGAIEFAREINFPICRPKDLIGDDYPEQKAKIDHVDFDAYGYHIHTGEPVKESGEDNAEPPGRPENESGGDNAAPPGRPENESGGDNAAPPGRPENESAGDNAAPPGRPENESGGDNAAPIERLGKDHDTASAVAIDAEGNFACATSTGGIAGKRKGRIGDAPLVGCGGYANEFGAATTTGHGEYIMRMTLAREAVFHMEGDEEDALPAQVSAEKALNRMSARVKGPGGIIAIDRNGNVGKICNTVLMVWASIKDDTVTFGLKPDEVAEEPL